MTLADLLRVLVAALVLLVYVAAAAIQARRWRRLFDRIDRIAARMERDRLAALVALIERRPTPPE